MGHLLVVGGGIAGASVAYWAAQAGWQVTVVDAGRATASHVPSALLNPVRGQSGKVPPRASEGLALTWALVQGLTAQGHDIPHGQTGVLRPVPDAAVQSRFQRHLGDLPHEWWTPEQARELRPGWHAALYLPQGGWLDGAALCRGLLAASGAALVAAEVQQVSREGAQLVGGRALFADRVVWCGGSLGAGQRTQGQGAASQSHRAGTLLTLAGSPGPRPLSFGAYLAPAAQGGVLGATFERPAAEWQPPQFPLSSLDWLLDKGQRLRPLAGLDVTGRWSGTRLSGLRAGPVAPSEWELSGLGSKGYLLGPLLARELMGRLSAEPV
ncbi:oxidoreductase [Deinococcus piscis]|uniref:Oxidoreductase n=1 Tax=Deinococcus piscis TaxID=394230 RepID=A0ABQ3JZQ1_9DEIO|nr:FAD-dependent oxidoreductase [Deinococcus piscis]GHF97317.1 oxidoreductase [Deinococcus piscis]